MGSSGEMRQSLTSEKGEYEDYLQGVSLIKKKVFRFTMTSKKVAMQGRPRTSSAKIPQANGSMSSSLSDESIEERLEIQRIRGLQAHPALNAQHHLKTQLKRPRLDPLVSELRQANLNDMRGIKRSETNISQSMSRAGDIITRLKLIKQEFKGKIERAKAQSQIERDQQNKENMIVAQLNLRLLKAKQESEALQIQNQSIENQLLVEAQRYVLRERSLNQELLQQSNELTYRKQTLRDMYQVRKSEQHHLNEVLLEYDIDIKGKEKQLNKLDYQHRAVGQLLSQVNCSHVKLKDSVEALNLIMK